MTDLADILARQRAAFLHDGAPDLAQRRADLDTLRRAIAARRPQIEAAINADFGHRSRHETAMMEILPTLQGIAYLSRNLRRFMRPERRHVDWAFRLGRARIEYQPLGVVGIISPWNYPLSLAMMPLATALAAGNRAMIKPSEFTPQTSKLLTDLLAEIFPAEKVAVVQGDAETGRAFTALPFDHILFTGSTPVGKAVMRAAADNLVPVTLELGGKSPVIVAPGAATEANVANIAFGKLANAGQTCIAPDYALVHEDDLAVFRSGFERAVAHMYPAGPSGADYSAIITARHFDRLEGLLSDAAAKGAEVVRLGAPVSEARPQTLAPALVFDATDAMEVMQQEIFGPILPVVSYRSIDEVIAFVNARPRPLALYHFGAEGADRRRLLDRTTSGNVGLNTTLMHYAQDDLPFGGIGASGIGAYHGIEGFRAMSHAKGIYAQSRWNGANLLRAPFGPGSDRLLNALLSERWHRFRETLSRIL
ncbi:aldehyde dehydrogenase [Paracoccus sp. MKU1]|nr:coniferyl aldehyde dehydrogenase [Paracoccus sp. MKU1]KRW96806.1 aldehyde dehydrogenase [Paracoccus sp. MKU1]